MPKLRVRLYPGGGYSYHCVIGVKAYLVQSPKHAAQVSWFGKQLYRQLPLAGRTLLDVNMISAFKGLGSTGLGCKGLRV